MRQVLSMYARLYHHAFGVEKYRGFLKMSNLIVYVPDDLTISAGTDHGQGRSTPPPSLPHGGDGDCVGCDDNVFESSGL